MEIIDAQIHTMLTDRPSRPWTPSFREKTTSWTLLLHAGQNNSNETAIQEMAEVGVDAALLSPVGCYGQDNSYELEGIAKFPAKFRVVGWVDFLADDVEERLANEASRGLVGVRIPELRQADRHERGEFKRVLAACERMGLVVSVTFAKENPDTMVRMFERHPGINFVVGHMGLDYAPPVVGVMPDDAFERLPFVLEFARFDNVNINLTGVPSFSRERFPFRDTWEPIRRIVDAFGVDRLMWGSDYTRTNALHSYWAGTRYLMEVPGLSSDDLAKLYGGTLRRVFNWPAGSLLPSES